jgi:hypothetical protein
MAMAKCKPPRASQRRNDYVPTEVLERCSRLEQRVTDMYSQFAINLNDDKALDSFWLRNLILEEYKIQEQ